ncbi:hypothetical protein LTR85_004377 [Meristemomyces frigidus]|nr:hypothetical protein LTR85_004377 [Meristemomyces frigidus]
MGSSSVLLSLPAELMLQILAELSVREIVRARAVCGELKSLIDAPENHNTLLTLRESRSLARIQESIRPVEYGSGTDFMAELKAYVEQHGITISTIGLRGAVGKYLTTFVLLLFPFAERWCDTQHGTQTTLMDLCAYDTDNLATAFVSEHAAWHLPDVPFFQGRKESHEFVEAVIAQVPRLGQSEEERKWLESAYWTLRSTPGGVFKDAKRGRHEQLLPEWPLTEIESAPYGTASPETYYKMEGFTSVKRLVDEFAVPSLPEIGEWAYCVKSKWAYDMIKTGMANIGRFGKAAVLEEMYLY